jgi:type I restriction enzyme S subunit
MRDEGSPCIHYGEIYTKYGTSAKTAFSFLDKTQAALLRSARSGDVIVASSGETIDDIGKAVAWLGSEDVVIHDACYAFRSPLDPRYVAYFFQTADFRNQIRRNISSSKISSISTKNLARVLIPVPRHEVQREITRVLDQFAQLEAELEAELEARRQQYEHYANALLMTGDDVARSNLGDLATIVRGASPRPIQSFITESADGVPWIKIGDVPSGGKYITGTAQSVTPDGAAKSRHVRPGDFVLSNSMSFGRPYISKIDGYIHDGWLAISNFEESFVPDYLYYLLRSAPIQAEFARRASTGTVKNLNADIVKSVSVPLPPRAEQEQVVELLDRFDALVNDLSIGLPAELAARRKQYEYYRDRLLTFEEATA